jgi:hypothetical protein
MCTYLIISSIVWGISSLWTADRRSGILLYRTWANIDETDPYQGEPGLKIYLK